VPTIAMGLVSRVTPVHTAMRIRISIQDGNFRGGPINLDYLHRDDRP